MLSALLGITHALPLACKSEDILGDIARRDYYGRTLYSFHAMWPLDGWNDMIIQPALDVVLDYYKVVTKFTHF